MGKTPSDLWADGHFPLVTSLERGRDTVSLRSGQKVRESCVIKLFLVATFKMQKQMK